MSATANYQSEANRIAGERIARLRALSYEQAASLPEASESETLVLDGTPCSITVFAQREPYPLPGAILVTVQVARQGFLGIASYHTERGLVFAPNAAVREATDVELRDSGG